MENNTRKKRKNSSKYHNFHTFCDPGCPIQPTGPFRDNIRLFLEECGEVQGYEVEGMQIWSTLLVHEKKGGGWSHHFVSKRRYHFIIPVDEDWGKPLKEGVFELQTHLLHGLIHCNGFGHLICINGIEGGSKNLCGKELMDLWDRICTNLLTRKITVEDLSKKHMMELRLLYGIAYGHPWFGKWGYRFCNGSFGVRHHTYDSALEITSSMPLDQIISDFSFDNSWKNIKQIIEYYRKLSETSLITLRDLFRFMLSPKSRIAFGLVGYHSTSNVSFPSEPCSRTAFHDQYVRKDKSGKCRNFTTVAANMEKDGRWSIRRLEFTASVIVAALKEKRAQNKNGSCVMSRQEARDAARLYIGDTGLIDHVLKSMSNVIVGDCIIRKVSNRTTKKLEFSIQEVKNGSQVGLEPGSSSQPVHAPPIIPGRDVYDDISYMYTELLSRYPESDVMNFAVRSILDSKNFVKEWLFRDEPDDMLRYICRLIPISLDLESEHIRNYSPVEYVELPLHATIGDLKVEVQSAMRDTYCTLEEMEIIEIAQMEDLADAELVFGIIESGSELSVRGYGLDLNTDLKHEGGADNWTVRCKCGAQDDDGERMVACDICEIWQHTRCIGIDDSEEVPPLFICETCCTSLAPQRSQRVFNLHNPSAFTIRPHMSDLPGNVTSSRCWELYNSEDRRGSAVSIPKLYC
ncbi:hypothetical protein Leryth_006405 [Lithospermum erythrorhizon]|nr:hypothetical protein Leryth_006405 [Lithospermum erythrorhizon]